MEAAAAQLFLDERVDCWYEELQHLLALIPSLPPAARRAVRDVLASFLREDGPASEYAQELLAAIAALERASLAASGPSAARSERTRPAEPGCVDDR